MKDRAQVVVIGGGIMGVSVAYHLCKLGWSDVMLLEKGELASGESGWAAGAITQFHTSPTMMQIRKYSIELYSELGLFRHVGSLRLASSIALLRELQRNVSQAKANGLGVDIISADEAVRLVPSLSKDGLAGALYLPRDGHLDPFTTTTQLARHAGELGASIHTHCRVTGIQVSAEGAVTEVMTDQGPIKTEIVVNAAGIWGPQVASMAGLHIPTTPVDHQHIALKAVPGVEFPHDTPVIRDPGSLAYLREEAGGLIVGGYELEPNARWIDGVPWEHGGKLLPPDYERFEPILRGLVQRFPFLERAESISLTCHPGAYTPDCRPLLGPLPGVRGFWCAAGLSLNGYGGAGGMGKVLAEWMTDGEPQLDVHSFHAWRFGRVYADPSYAAERTREGVKYYYFLRYPNDENEWARPRRVSPVHNRLQELGAVFGEKNGWERPNYFQPGEAWRRAGADQRVWGWSKPPYFARVGDEHRACRERVALFDMSSFGKIQVEGPGALALLQRLTDNQMDVPTGKVVYTQLVNRRGGIEADVTITRLDTECFRVVTGSAFVANDMGVIRMGMRPGDAPVVIRDTTEELATLGIWGPRSRDVLGSVSGADLSNQAFPYMSARAIDLRGLPVWAQRVTYVGELGWELYSAPEHTVQLWDSLREAGRSHGLEPAGYKVLDSLRLEKGYRYYGADMTTKDDPYSAGLSFCVRLNKGEFLGRESLLALKREGVTRKLCTMTVGDGDYHTLYGGESVLSGAEVVGRVRSAGYGYTIGKQIAYAYLPISLTAEGTRLAVEEFDHEVPAMVSRDVLVDPDGLRIHA